MKLTAKLTIIAVLVVCLAGSVLAGKRDRKLTVGAYISSAKIEIISGDLERYETAIAYLDSLFLNYGPHAEGLKLMAQVQVDFLAQATDPEEKMGYVEKLVAYVDSLHACCENEDINKKYRKNCKKHVEFADSLKVQYWRDFYNLGIEQLKILEDYQSEIASATDSSYKADYERRSEATLDTLVTNMQMVALLNKEDHRAYLGLSSAYEKVGDFKQAMHWLDKSMEYSSEEDKPNLLLRLAYMNIQANDFCGAVPYFKSYTELDTTDLVNLGNLAICYNNCGFYDSAASTHHRVLHLDPQSYDALIGLGRFHNQQARSASDSATEYRKLENEEGSAAWNVKRDEAFDSSLVYFEEAADIYPDSIEALEQYGTIVGLKSMYAEAAKIFRKLANLDPSIADYPRAAGDFFLQNHQFDEAIVEYERTIERDPGDAETWERLADLYDNEGLTDKAAAAKKKVEELR